MRADTQVVMATEWRHALWLVLGVTLAFLMLFAPTYLSMARTWERSETFAHGWLIVPISLWVAWSERRFWLATEPRAEPVLLLPLGLTAFAWLAGEVTGTQIVQQFAAVAMLVLGAWSVIGHTAAWQLFFPLSFLFLAVPVGEGLIPPLMDFTANFSVACIRLTGVPVFQEGTFISLPSSEWSVVEGCSGLRYLIATITLGYLYAYLTYQSFSRRLLFVLAAIVVPVIANGLRAFLIMMIGHMSSMQLAGGVDHILYGWVFFGIVIFVMFSVGSIWREALPKAPVRKVTGSIDASRASAHQAKLQALGVLGVGVLAVAWSALSLPQASLPALALPGEVAGFKRLPEQPQDWRPEVQGADLTLAAEYQDAEGARVQVELACFAYSRQDHELLNSQNRLLRQKHPEWRLLPQATHTTGLAAPAAVHEAEVRANASKGTYWVWDWWWLGGQHFLSPHLGKLLEARARLFGGSTESCWLVIATPYQGKPEPARSVLQAFAPALAAWRDQAKTP